MEPFKILIAEDDKWYGELLQYHLELNPDWEVYKVGNGKDLLKALSKRPNVITLDYSLPDMTGADLLKRIKLECPNSEVIVVSGQEDVRTAIDLMKEGAYDYIVKDDDTKNRLWKSITRIKKTSVLRKKWKSSVKR